MNQIEKAKRMFSRVLLRQELVTYLVPVPVIVSFFLLTFSDTPAKQITLLVLAVIASALAFLPVVVTKLINYRPIVAALKLIERGEEDPVLFAVAKRQVYRLPFIDSITLFFRWNIAVAFVVAGLALTTGISAVFTTSFVVFGLLNSVISIPLYFIICELEGSWFLNLPAIARTPPVRRVKVSLSLKLLVCLFSIIIYLISVLSMIIMLGVTGNIDLKSSLVSLGLLDTGSLLLVGILVYYLSRSISTTVRNINDHLDHMNRDEGDLTYRLDIYTSDDIGDMSLNFNDFLSHLSSSLKNIRSVSFKSREMGENLSSSSAENSSAITQTSRIMSSMNDRTLHLSDELGKSRSSVSEISANIDRIVRLMDAQSASISESSASITQTLSSIGMIERSTLSGRDFAARLADKAKGGEERMKQNVGIVQEIEKSAEVIGELTEVIREVSSQADLLAMNAAIEAAHSGDAGKGFSVVADEIKMLALSTRETTERVSSSVKGILEQIAYSSAFTSETDKLIEEIIGGIGGVHRSFEETLAGLKEITLGNRQITDAIQELVAGTQEINESGKRIYSEISSIELSMKRIHEQAQENKDGITEVTIGLTQLSNSTQALSQLSEKNSENIVLLDSELSKFKTA